MAEDSPPQDNNESTLATTMDSTTDSDNQGMQFNQIHLDVSDEDGQDNQATGEAKRSQTFRQRRLTYTSHHLQGISDELLAGSDLESQEDDSESLSAESKRKLHKLDDVDSSEHKRTRSNHDKDNDGSTKEDVTSPAPATETPPKTIKSRFLHASAPPKPTCPNRQSHLLYQHPPNVNDTLSSLHNDELSHNEILSPHLMATASQEQQEPEWKKTHTSRMIEEGSLPFPTNMVGTYSCHGIEPVYETGEFKSLFCNGGTAAPTATAKINQDRGGIAFPYANCPRTALFAAYDGHGDGGELVSQFALHEVPKRLERHEEFKKGNFEKAFKDVFVDVNDDLEGEPDIEPLYSGCTACVALVKDDEIYLSNAGDSRAVMASRRNDYDTTSEHQAFDLTVDQNPDSPGEQERIEMCGGFVSPPPEVGLSARVWLDSKFSQIGLAMARSIGDYAVKKVGVIAEPVVTKYGIKDEDDFMIIATDGVWEFLSSQDAVDIVSKDFKNGECSSLACQHLIEAAAAKWHEHEGDYRDDITALVIKVKELWKT